MSRIKPPISLHFFLQSVFLIGVVFINLYWLNEILLPVTMGVVFGIVLNPVYQRLLKRGWRGWFASLLVTLGFLIIFLIPTGGLLFSGVRAGLEMVEKAPWLHVMDWSLSGLM